MQGLVRRILPRPSARVKSRVRFSPSLSLTLQSSSKKERADKYPTTCTVDIYFKNKLRVTDSELPFRL